MLARSSYIPDIVTAGGATVGVRWPSHPFIQAVIRVCGFPLAAPSANLSNQLSPTSASHVMKSFDGKLPLVVDGGCCQVGIESTVLDISSSPPRVLRPGMVHEQSLLAVTGELAAASPSSGILKSPGQLPKHYAPKAKVVMASWQNDAEFKVQSSKFKVQGSKLHVVAHTHIPSVTDHCQVSVIPHDPEAFARALYAELHLCDEAGAELIMVEALPESPEWNGIRDRLNRAAAG